MEHTTAVSVKALTDTTATIAGYGVVFGGKDLFGETFNADTDFALDLVPVKPVLYDHRLGAVKHWIGKVVKVAPDEYGLWVEAELERNKEYVAQVLELVEKGALGWSSGTAGHMATREGGVIKSWPLLEFSLTPTPAEARTLGVEMIKSLAESDASFEALLPEADAATSAAGADDVGEHTEPAVKQGDMPKEMKMDTEVKAVAEAPAVDMAALVATLVSKMDTQADELKSLRGQLDAEPAQNKQNFNVTSKTKLGDDETKAFTYYLRTGDASAISGTRAYNATDMNIATSADGGYAVPTGLYNQIIARRDELSLVPKLGLRNIPGKGLTVNVPLDAEADVLFTSVAEAGSIGLDAPALGQKAFTLVKYAKYITLSWELLRDEDAQLMAFVNDWVARGIAATENNLLITEALANGTAALTLDSATAIGAAEIPELEGKLMPEYQDGAAWIMHPTTYANLRGLFGTSQFVFTPGVGGITPGFGYPVHLSSYATALGASAKSMIFGNFNFMGFRRATTLQVLNDPYTGAGTGQTKMWFWFDAVFGVLQAEAIQYATHPSA